MLLETWIQQLVGAVVSGLLGGIVTGLAALIAIRIELRWHLVSIERLEKRLDHHDNRLHRLEDYRHHGTP